MSIIIDGTSLTIKQIVDVSRKNSKVSLSEESINKIKFCRKLVEDKINSGEIMYGINTGIGEFSETILEPNQIEDFQKYLIYNHSAGIGDPSPIEHVRAAMLSRINVHSKGMSGCRLIITATLIEMLNKGVTPFVCSKGSVGACGDLAPMAQIALVLLGEGKAYYKDKLYSGQEAMNLAKIEIPGLKARDGLSVINGSNFLTSMSALFIYDAQNWFKQCEIAAAMSFDALLANVGPLNHLIHKVRGFDGAVKSANSIRKNLKNGDLFSGKIKTKLQDAYSLRSTPQVIGAAIDYLDYCKKQVEIELNGVGDNPIFFVDKGMQLSGANFQGTPISLPLDTLGSAVTMVSVLSERRMNRLNNPALSNGLPPFLTKGAGMFSGLMLSQYTADMQIVEQRILSSPASIHSIPAAADQEDFVSMGMNTALKNFQIIDNAYGILGIEFMAAAQALDFRKHLPGDGVKIAKNIIREEVDFLDIDRPLYSDHNTMKKLIKSCKILDKVELSLGNLYNTNNE
tara:strand:+ start:764 stop:2302 length:1539 start_codon:yes stop_codon:yes gene_type:complete